MVDIAVRAMDAEHATCRPLKETLVKVMVDKDKFVDLQEYNEVVSVENAKKAFPDFEAFLKRNRFNDKNTMFMMNRIKNDEDMETLRPFVEKLPNGWVDLTKLDESTKASVLADCSKTDRMNAWEMLSFDETDAACAKCPLAWYKGRECIGAFGPETSALPEIARKYDCPIIASAVESASTDRQFTAEDAKELLREAELLAPKLIEEGKMAAHRYSGPVERLQAIAKACVAENCGFYFI